MQYVWDYTFFEKLKINPKKIPKSFSLKLL